MTDSVSAAPRWRGYSADERKAEMQRVSDGRRRQSLNKHIDKLAAHARILSPDQLARLAALVADGGSGGGA